MSSRYPWVARKVLMMTRTGAGCLVALLAVQASAGLTIQPDAVNSDIVKIVASATDDVGVTGMTLYIDGVVRSSCAPCSTITYNWNVKRVAPGEHVIRATARDAAGNEGFDQVTVTRR